MHASTHMCPRMHASKHTHQHACILTRNPTHILTPVPTPHPAAHLQDQSNHMHRCYYGAPCPSMCPSQGAAPQARTSTLPARQVQSPISLPGSHARQVQSPISIPGSHARQMQSPISLLGSHARQSRPCTCLAGYFRQVGVSAPQTHLHLRQAPAALHPLLAGRPQVAALLALLEAACACQPPAAASAASAAAPGLQPPPCSAEVTRTAGLLPCCCASQSLIGKHSLIAAAGTHHTCTLVPRAPHLAGSFAVSCMAHARTSRCTHDQRDGHVNAHTRAHNKTHAHSRTHILYLPAHTSNASMYPRGIDIAPAAALRRASLLRVASVWPWPHRGSSAVTIARQPAEH